MKCGIYQYQSPMMVVITGDSENDDVRCHVHVVLCCMVHGDFNADNA